ncbi:uncharacterized protein [Anabrus simplex]|uniref:uncharacterized protein n=1 Tax=Anabrus simplex TaxID=316456 RepID=UPI0035A2B5A2
MTRRLSDKDIVTYLQQSESEESGSELDVVSFTNISAEGSDNDSEHSEHETRSELQSSTSSEEDDDFVSTSTNYLYGKLLQEVNRPAYSFKDSQTGSSAVITSQGRERPTAEVCCRASSDGTISVPQAGRECRAYRATNKRVLSVVFPANSRRSNGTVSPCRNMFPDIAIPADERPPPAPRGWLIPRPSLWCADPACPCHIQRPQPGRASTASQGSSNISTQSGGSGSLLLTVANLKEPDSVSLASSTHFTVVNGLERRKTKPLPSCCWHKHQLTALVVAMSIIFLVAILLAVLALEMRWRDIHMFQ